MRTILSLIFTTLLTGPSCLAARKALVIGNAHYAVNGLDTLDSPVNDAEDIAARLKTMSFDVTMAPDLGKVRFEAAVNSFVASLAEGDTALFYYAGHAIQVNGQNFLWPIDQLGTDELQIETNLISIQTLYNGLRLAKTDINIVILDACRDNPFAPASGDGFTPGLALPRNTPDSSFIAYSTKENDVALDVDLASEPRKHSPYTKALLSQMSRTGVPISEVFRELRNIVDAVSGKVPVVENTLKQVFYFRPPVTIEAELRDVDDTATVMLDGLEQFSTASGVESRLLLLHGGENHIAIKVFNQRSFTGGIEFLGGRKPEGWHYRAAFRREGSDLLREFTASEDEPRKDGPRHGALFTVATFTILVDDETGSVQVDTGSVDRNAWMRAGVPPGPPGILTENVRRDLEWAKANSGNPGCPTDYLPYIECLIEGQRSCLMRQAKILAETGSPNEAFRLALVTQCQNTASQEAMRRAGMDIITAWLRQH